MTTNTPARETQHTQTLEAKRVDMTHAVLYGADGMIVARMAAHEFAWEGAQELAHRFNAHAALVAEKEHLHKSLDVAVDCATAKDQRLIALQAQNEALVAALRAACNALSELATSLPGGQAQIFADNAADAASAALRAAQEPPHG